MIPDSTETKTDDTENRLDLVLARMSEIMAELGSACAELQTVQNAFDPEMDNDAIIKAQALDRVTQSLESLSSFSAALSEIPSARLTVVGDTEFEAITLCSVRNQIRASSDPAETERAEDITLFD